VAPPIHFHFDYLSPYAYLAWTQIHALAARAGREVVPVPTLFAALLAHGATKGPAEIPAKRVYVFKDALRSARLLGVPLEPPPSHPFNPLVALRASSIVEGDPQRRLVDALFRAAWGGEGGVEGEERVAALASSAGLDGGALVARCREPSVKERLRLQTDEAIAAGVFGVPTMRVDGEIFWGLDSFGHVERFLRGEDPLRADELARWRHVAASAVRR
jgi:2-hydroxychromene-2-carboxylate isomerase